MDAQKSPPHSKATSLPLPGSQSEISNQLSEEGRCQHGTALALRLLLPSCCVPRPSEYWGGDAIATAPQAECGYGAGPLPRAFLLQGLSHSSLYYLGTATSHQHWWMLKSQRCPSPVLHGTPGDHGSLSLFAATTPCLSFPHLCLAQVFHGAQPGWPPDPPGLNHRPLHSSPSPPLCKQPALIPHPHPGC